MHPRRLRVLLVCATLAPSALWMSAPALAQGSASSSAPTAAPSLAVSITPAGSPAPAKAAASAAWASAYARGQWAAAIELLETIPESSRTAWHWLHLARAREKRVQLVEAFAAYERLLDVAAEAPRAPGMKDTKQQAQAESAALALRIPWAQVTLASNVPLGGLVYVDHQWLQPDRLRVPYPVNPGWHTFLVESNGQVLAARRVHFEEGQSRVVPLASFESSAPASALETKHRGAGSKGALGAGSSSAGSSASLERDDDPWGIDSAKSSWGTPSPSRSRGKASGASYRSKSSAASRSGSLPEAPPLAATPESPAAGHSLTWRAPEQAEDKPTDALLTSAYVSLGIGAVGALVGTGFAIAAHNAKDKEEVRSVGCYYAGCLDGMDAANSQWRQRATIAGASYAVGLMGLVTGGILWLAHREYSSSKTTLQIADLELELEPGLRTDGAYLRGKF